MESDKMFQSCEQWVTMVTIENLYLTGMVLYDPVN